MHMPVPSIGLLFASILPESSNDFLNRSDLALTVRHDKIIIYKGRDSAYHAKKRDPLCEKNLLKRSYQGVLSKSAIKHISKQITLWSDTIETYNKTFNLTGKKKKRQLIFLTTTLPSKQIHTDNEIKRIILVPFIDALKYHFGIRNYFWRAEAQKNDNIHFHIILDKYVPYEIVRDLWNQTCEKLGYITRFEAKHKHRNPNSVDLRVISNSKNTIKYVMKYATKQEGTRLLKGRLWGMSDSLRMLKVPTYFNIKDHLKEILHYCEKSKIKINLEEHFMTIQFKQPVINELSNTKLSSQLNDHYLKVYSYLYFEDSPFDNYPNYTFYQGLDYHEILSIAKVL
jgi:hypothetical protein